MEKPIRSQFEFHFEWEQSKARQNVKKHGMSFERAASVFLDPNALSEFDSEHSQAEDRWLTLGLDRTGLLLVVCHAYWEEASTKARIRIISARRATKQESNQYRRS